VKRCVFIVGGSSFRQLNDRVRKLSNLSSDGLDITVVTSDRIQQSAKHLPVAPFKNFVGIFRKIGLRRVARYIENRLYFPSRKILYVRAVIRALEPTVQKLLRIGHEVTVLTCAPPHDIGLVGLELKRRHPKVTWIFDWQDLWSYDGNYFNHFRPILKDRVRKLERDYLENIDVNVTTNSYASEVLASTYKVPKERLVAINHHYSVEDRPSAARPTGIVPQDDEPRIRIGYLGTLFKPPRVPGSQIVRGISKLRSDGLPVELHVYGDTKIHLKDQQGIYFHARCPHKESLDKIAECNFLLVTLADLPNSKAVMSIKLPHYMMLDVPIIAIVPDPSAVADMVRNSGTGYVLPISGNWVEALRELLTSGGSAQSVDRVTAVIERFSWPCISRQWEDLLITAGRPRAPSVTVEREDSSVDSAN